MNEDELDINVAKAAGAEIKDFVAAFLTEQSKPEPTMQEKLDRSNNERDRAVAICDAIMNWENPADARKTSKDLSQLKKDMAL
jgi:hypothetical protein